MFRNYDQKFSKNLNRRLDAAEKTLSEVNNRAKGITRMQFNRYRN